MDSKKKLLQMLSGYRESMLIIALHKLSICEQLTNAPMVIDEIIENNNINPLAAEALLNACVAIGLLEKKGGLYSNSEISDTFLVSSSLQYIGNVVSYHMDYIPFWSSLPQALVATEADFNPPEFQSSKDPKSYRIFIRGVHDAHIDAVESFAESVELEGYYSLLDVGGGAGTYSITLLRKYPNLRSTLVDFQAVLEVSKEIIKEVELYDRFKLISMDFDFYDIPTEDFDVILFSNVLHLKPRNSAKKWLKKSYEALPRGGKIIINEPTLNDQKTFPESNAVFNLTVILRSGLRGSLFSESELLNLTKGAGFLIQKKTYISPDLDLYHRPYFLLEAIKFPA